MTQPSEAQGKGDNPWCTFFLPKAHVLTKEYAWSCTHVSVHTLNSIRAVFLSDWLNQNNSSVAAVSTPASNVLRTSRFLSQTPIEEESTIRHARSFCTWYQFTSSVARSVNSVFPVSAIAVHSLASLPFSCVVKRWWHARTSWWQ